jgi:hypothetical protein
MNAADSRPGSVAMKAPIVVDACSHGRDRAVRTAADGVPSAGPGAVPGCGSADPASGDVGLGRLPTGGSVRGQAGKRLGDALVVAHHAGRR